MGSFFKSGTLSSTTISAIGCILSAGSLCMPQAFKFVGIYPGLALLLFGAWLSLYTHQLILYCCRYGELFSYEAISYKVGGNSFLILISFFIFIMNIGFQVSQLVMTATMISDIVRDYKLAPADSIWADSNSFRIQAAIIQFGIVFPINLLRRMKDFLAITIAQVGIIIQVIFVIVVISILQQGEYIKGSDPFVNAGISRYQPNMDMNLETRYSLLKWQSVDVKDQLVAFPFFIFAFAGQPWVLGVYEGLERRNIIRAFKIMDRTIIFIQILLALISIFGQMTFLDLTRDNILLNDQADQQMGSMCNQIILFAIIFNMPQNMVPLRNNLLKLFCGLDYDQIDQASLLSIFLTALASNIFCYAFSIITPDVGDVITVLSCTLNVFMCQMMPCVFYVLIMVNIEHLNWFNVKNLLPMFVCILSGVLGFVSLLTFINEKIKMSTANV